MENYIVRGLSHIGISTDRVEEACRFYIDNLGFKPYYKKELNGLSCWFVENHGLILEFVSRGKAEAGGPIYHLSLEVCNIEGLVESLKQKGILQDDAEISKNPDFFPSGIKNIFFNGPCGERIELFELAHD